MNDEIELLRRHRHDPVAPDVSAREAARLALARAIEDEARSHRRPVRFSRRRRRPGPRLAATAALALLVALGIAGLLDKGASTPRALAAGTVLRRLAQVAEARSPTKPGPGQFLYTATTSLTESDTAAPGGVYCRAVFPQHRRDWVAENGEGLTIEEDGQARYRSAAEARACSAVPLPPAETRWNWAAEGCMSIEVVPLAKLPLDPGRLRARLLTGKVEGGPPGPAEAFVQVGDLLRKTDAPAGLRVALFKAAAGLRGVRSLGGTTDRYGRRGVVLAIDHGAYRSELVFSLASSDLLEERQVLLRAQPGVEARPGAALGWTTYSVPKLAAALPKASPLPLTPRCIRGGETGRQVPGHANEFVNVGFRSKR